MGDVGQVKLDCRVVFGGSLLCCVEGGPASVSGSELLVSRSSGLMGHRCYTGGSSRAPSRRRSARCSSPCGGATALLVGELLLSLWENSSSLKRWSSCCCSSTAACRLFRALERRIVNKLSAVTSSPPPFLRTAILILSNNCQKKVHMSVYFPLLIKTHTLKWSDINNIDFMRLHRTNHSFSPFLFAHVGLDYQNCFALHP